MDRDRDRPSRPKHLTFAGGLGAGLFSVLCTSPFDIVKTRMQSTEAKNYARARRARRSGTARKPPRRSDVEGATRGHARRSTVDCFKQIATKEGPKAFFNGALARSARVVPGQGIIFLSVDLVYDAIAAKVETSS